MDPALGAAIEKLRSGDEHEALTELIEMPQDILPAIVQAYRNEQSPDTRMLLVKVAWERRDPAAISFISEALDDADEYVWQEALDGCVALASPEILEILQTAQTRPRAENAMSRQFRICVDEAVLYVKGLIQRR